MRRNKKPFWRSKTLWINGLTVIAGLAGSKVLDGLMAPGDVAILLGVTNVILRVLTTERLGGRSERDNS